MKNDTQIPYAQKIFRPNSFVVYLFRMNAVKPKHVFLSRDSAAN
jgi:hypothetical protein